MRSEQTATLGKGTVLEDKWIIIELIGKGAMGEVYRAHQTNLKRDVAIKIISQEVMAEIEDDPEELDIAFGRFQREVQAMAQVRHANVLTIYDYGEIKSDDAEDKFHTAFIVMEYIPGNTLRFTMEEAGVDDDPRMLGKWIRSYFLPILDGVEVLHANSIVHRDLKPENVFMDGEVPKVADFGLSRSYRMKAVTTSIEMLGTLAYMSPEQCADFKNSDFRTDIYALGKMLYEAAHGTLTQKTVPFTSVSLENPQSRFLEALNRVLLRATEENPEERYQSVPELRSELVNALVVLDSEMAEESTAKSPVFTEKGSRAKPRWLLVGGMIFAIISVAAMAIYHVTDSQEPAGGPAVSADFHQESVADELESVKLPAGEEPAPFMLGRDGNRMMLTGTSEPDSQKLFYVDEKKISNFLFVEFLNNLGDGLAIDRGVVRFQGKILFYIDEGPSGESPIIYRHNTFHLKDQDRGGDPVVRVTYHGAHLFAATYGKSLLTAEEWRFAYFYHLSEKSADHVPSQPSTMMSMMHSTPAPTPVQESGPKALDNMGVNLKEWVQIDSEGNDKEAEGKKEGYASGVMDAERAGDNKPPLRRLPWEGFENVGFRTKIPIHRQ